jgi:hypothetical protein
MIYNYENNHPFKSTKFSNSTSNVSGQNKHKLSIRC